MEIKYDNMLCFKVGVMGAAAVGKTAIISRLVNNHFPIIYEPTKEVNNTTLLFNLNDPEIKQKTYVMVTLEDMFAINNPLLQTPEHLISSVEMKQQRTEMSEIFKGFMFSSKEKRDKLSNEAKKPKTLGEAKKITKINVYEKLFDEDPSIERKGFVFVCDATDDKSADDIITLLDKLNQIEKSNDLTYPKGVFINKVDKADKEKLKKIVEKLDQVKAKYKFIDVFKTSALTNYGIVESFKKFLSRIHQIEADSKQNEGYEDKSDDDDDKNDKVKIIIFMEIFILIYF